MGLLNAAHGLIHVPGSALGWTLSKIKGGSRNLPKEQQASKATTHIPAAVLAKTGSAACRSVTPSVSPPSLPVNPVLSQKEAIALVASKKVGQEGTSAGATSAHEGTPQTRSPSPEYDTRSSVDSSPLSSPRSPSSSSSPPPARTANPDARSKSIQRLLVAARLAQPHEFSAATPVKSSDAVSPDASSMQDQRKKVKAKRGKKDSKCNLSPEEMERDKLRAMVAQIDPELVTSLDIIWVQGGMARTAVDKLLTHLHTVAKANINLVKANANLVEANATNASELQKAAVICEGMYRATNAALYRKKQYKKESSRRNRKMTWMTAAFAVMQPRSYPLSNCPMWIEDSQPQPCVAHVRSRLSRCTF